MKMTSISLPASPYASIAYNRKRFLSVHNCFESRLHYLGFRNHSKDDSTPADVKGRMNRNFRPTEGWNELHPAYPSAVFNVRHVYRDEETGIINESLKALCPQQTFSSCQRGIVQKEYQWHRHFFNVHLLTKTGVQALLNNNKHTTRI